MTIGQVLMSKNPTEYAVIQYISLNKIDFNTVGQQKKKGGK